MHILLADDHPVALHSLHAFLAQQPDFDVSGMADNGDTLLAWLESRPCDLVVCDYSMPGGLEGWPLLTAILRRFPHVALIAFTGFADPTLVMSLKRLGVHGIVSKRDALEEVEAAIFSSSTGNCYLSPECQHALTRCTESAECARLSRLTLRELEVLGLFVAGLTITESARLVGRSEKTVSAQKHAAMRKLGARCDLQLYRCATALGLQAPPSPG